jgi:hypothetical protein
MNISEIISDPAILFWYVIQNGYRFALFAFFFPFVINRARHVGRDGFTRVLTLVSLISLIPLFSGMILRAVAPAEQSFFQLFNWWLVVAYTVTFIASAVLGAILLRVMGAWWDSVKHRFTRRTNLERNRKTDVREIHKFIPPPLAKGFDPRNFFNPKKGIFVGLSEQRKPVYLPYDDLRSQHVLLTGRTRWGKGVAAQILIPQLLARGEYVAVLDPKFDEWMPHAFYSACLDAGLPYRFADINQAAPAQLNPCTGCDTETLENMLIGGFSLTEKGDPADFYRLADRRAARRCAAWLAANPGSTARDALVAHGDHWAEEAPAFFSYMQEMGELDSVNADSGGFDIAEGLKNGGLLYTVGDMINPRILRMQRMILLRLLFLAKQSGYTQRKRTIFVFADEFKAHISRPFMVALGASAGWGLHAMLAMQSIKDLKDCPADLDAEAVEGSIMENCSVQLSYRLKDPDTAEWLARGTGMILVDDEMRKVGRNAALAETVSGERTIRQSERPYIDTNMLLNLPKGCGMLTEPSTLPQFVYTSPPHVVKVAQAVRVTPAPGAVLKGHESPVVPDPLL